MMQRLSNSFNFIMDKEVHVGRGEQICKILLNVESPIRTICMLKGCKYFLYHTDTGDFKDEEISEIKYRYQQIYLQTDNELYITDFQKQLKKLKISTTCKRCVHKYRCPLIWEIEVSDLFEEGEVYIRDILKRLSGNILDIGCGSNLRYRDILLKNNRISSYTGVDPSKEAIRAGRENFKGRKVFTFINSEIEKTITKMNKIKFDLILLLRSINHIRDTERLLQECMGLLNNDGMIVIADNIPFGLIRGRDIIEKIKDDQRHKLHFEHYHNFSSTDIIPVLHRIGLKIMIHRPVLPTSANQWMVVSKK